jgi:MFS transporter, PAT family, beta-lactamase induction signal transducer AmpG
MSHSARSCKPPLPQRPSVWCFTTYFAEGMPYMLVRILSTVYYTDIGARLSYIGYLNFLGLPWNFKFLWAPFLDHYGSKRRWMALMQGLLGAALLGVAALNLGGVALMGGNGLTWIALLFVFMAFAAATNDIAIDAFYMEGLPERRDQALFSGYRIMAYRLSMIFVRSGLVALAALLALSAGGNLFRPWGWTFLAAAVIMLLLAFFHLRGLPRGGESRSERPERNIRQTFSQAFVTYLNQEKAALVLAFIVLYKVGDEIMFSMATPFLMRGLGMTKAQYAWVSGIVGAAGAVLGVMLGGWWIKKRGLRRAILPLTLLMNLNMWAYIALAWLRPNPATVGGIAAIAFVHGYEQVASGLGGAALLVFLLGTCQPEFKAAHYAIGSAFMSLFATVFGGFGGRIVEAIGFTLFFMLAFLATIPGMLLLRWVPMDKSRGTDGGSGGQQ